MVSEVYWINDPNIIQINCIGEVTSAGLIESISIGAELANYFPLYVLINLSENTAVPSNLANLTFSNEVFVKFLNHPNVRAFAFVGGNSRLNLSIKTVIRGDHVCFANHDKDGLAFLQSRILKERLQ